MMFPCLLWYYLHVWKVFWNFDSCSDLSELFRRDVTVVNMNGVYNFVKTGVPLLTDHWQKFFCHCNMLSACLYFVMMVIGPLLGSLIAYLSCSIGRVSHGNREVAGLLLTDVNLVFSPQWCEKLAVVYVMLAKGLIGQWYVFKLHH